MNDCLTRAVRLARQRLGSRYRRFQEKLGPPAEHTALSSLHFLMEEYQEPAPFEVASPYGMAEEYPEAETRTESIEHPLGQGKLRIDLTFPPGAGGALPTVVISPGLGAHRAATRYIERHLASRGFLVARPTHSGSDWAAVALKTPLGAFTRVELRRRVAELRGTLLGLESNRWGFCPAEGQLCLMGHSFGALTSALFAGLSAAGIEVDSPLPVDALVMLSPYGNSFPTQRLRIDPASFSDLIQPTLFISGTQDDLWTLGKGSRSHLEPYFRCRSPVKSHLLIGGTRHGHFSEILGWVRRDTRIMVNSTVTAFLDAHLLDRSEGLDYLSNQLSMVAYEHGSWVL